TLLGTVSKIGEYCRIIIPKCDEITVNGKYSLKSDSVNELDLLSKYRLIQTFIKNWNGKIV
ncbi:MAG: hypothetical protein RR034_01510, partial [Bacteroidales bacterium]